MGCGCKKTKTTYRVVASGGKTVYTSTSEQVAKRVASRYPGSEVESSGPGATKASTAPGKTPLKKS